jgi:hypothetical protein
VITDSRLEFNPASTGTFFIHVSEFRGDARPDFQYDLFVGRATPPANYNFANAALIASTPYSTSVDTRLATADPTDPRPSCAIVPVNGGTGKSVWFRFTPALAGTFVADTFRSTYDTILAVFTGSPGPLAEVACNDDAGAGVQSQVVFAAQAGTTYHIMVSASTNDGGTLILTLVNVTPPPNDNFSNAAAVGSMLFTDRRDTRAATIEASDPVPPCGAAPFEGGRGKSVWYRLTTGSSGGTITADTFRSSYDTILSVWTGSPGGFTPVACNDDFAGLQSRVWFPASANTTYFFMVSDSNNLGGALVFHLVFAAGSSLPTIRSLSPSSAVAGGPDFTLTVYGSGFVAGSVVEWNGSSRTTTVVASSQLQALIPASDLAVVGTAQVTVLNPAPGGGLSNALPFMITAPPTALGVASLSFTPSSVTAGQSSTGTVTLTGPGPNGGIGVSLSSNNPAVHVPTSVTVPAGSVATAFTATTSSVTTLTVATVTATLNGTVQATLTVNPPTAIVSLNTSTVYATGTVGQANPMPRGVRLREATGSTVAWKATTDVPWATIKPSTGNTPALIAIAVELNGLAAGTYLGKLTIQSPTNTFIPLTATIMLIVNAAPVGNVERSIASSQNRVDGYDLIRLARAFGATPGSPNWDPAVNLVDRDTNGNGVIDPEEMIIDAEDLAELAKNFGK